MTRRNPLDGLVPALAAPSSRDPGVRVSDAVVTGLSPLTVRQVGAADDTTPLTPLPLVPAGDLEVGARVLLMHRGTQKILLGHTRGGASDHTAWEPLTLSAPWGQYGPATTWGEPSICARDGIVWLRGMVSGGTQGTSAEPLAILPVWARPTRHRIGTVLVNDQPVTYQVTPVGTLHLRGAYTTGWVALSSISFPL